SPYPPLLPPSPYTTLFRSGHMTVGLGVAITLKEMESELPYGVRIVFQPAEETGEGAKAVLKTGVIDPLQYLFGMHVRPLVELERSEEHTSELQSRVDLVCR